jgi:glycosyltransferase involved in cell wall biosynthesis
MISQIFSFPFIILFELLCLFMYFLVFYAYAGYPLLLALLIKIRGEKKSENLVDLPTSMTLIIACRNEKSHLREKLENSLLVVQEVAPTPVEIIVASDASDDGSDEIVHEYASRGIKLVRAENRQGKEATQRLAIQQAQGSILVFTDTKVTIEAGSLIALLQAFRDPTIGSVSSTDRVISVKEQHHVSQDKKGSGEGMYVRYEMWLRRLETRFGTIVGLSGSFFAVRAELARNLRTDVPSDFSLLLATLQTGKRGIISDQVIGAYREVQTEEQEFERKVRTVIRGMRTFFSTTEVFSFFRYGFFTWQILSHKLGRWLAPVFLCLGYALSLGLADMNIFFLLLSLGQTIFFLFAFFGFVIPELRSIRVIKIPLFFCITNLAILVAWVKFLSGEKAVTWTPSAKGY